jgi:outer membrane protein TolC
MFGFTLPWLNPSWDELAREAEANAEADRSALEAAEVAAQFRLRTARARVAADRETLRVIEESVLPTAQMSVEALEAGLAAGRSTATDVLDALRTLLLVRIEKNRAHARLETSLADLDRALGRLPAGVEEELR